MTFIQTVSYTPKEIRAPGVDESLYVKLPITVDVGQSNLRSGTVMGRVTATGKFKAYSSVAVDGSQIPLGFLVQDNVDPATVGRDLGASLYITGWFMKDQLVGLDTAAQALMGKSYDLGGAGKDLFALGAVLGGTANQALYRSWTGGQAAATSTTAIHAAANGALTPVTVSTGITQPSCPRALTVTGGGTAGDIATSNVTVNGADEAGAALSEVFAFSANTAATVQGSKAFARVDNYVIDAQDGTGCTFAVGVNDKLGIGRKLPLNTVISASLNGTPEGTAPTVAFSASVLASNTVDLNSALNGTAVVVVFFDPVQLVIPPIPS